MVPLGFQITQAGIILDTFCALLAPSQPSSPTLGYLLQMELSWSLPLCAALVAPYAKKSPTAPPTPGNKPVTNPISPPLNHVFPMSSTIAKALL